MSAPMSDADKANPHNTRLQGGADFKVPANRGCTDCLFLILIIAMWGGMTLLGLIVTGAIKNPNLPPGDPRRLLAPVDASGQLCGVDAGVKSRPLGYYLPSASYVCIDQCPTVTDPSKFYCSGEQWSRTLSPSSVQKMVSNNTCMFHVKTKNVLHYCVPWDPNYMKTYAATYGGAFNGTMSGVSSTTMTDLMQDFLTARGVILGFGLGIAAALGFVYLLLLQIPGVLCLLVWGILFAIEACFIGIGGFSANIVTEWGKEDPQTHSGKEIMAVKYAGYVFYAIAALGICFLLFMRKRINLAMAVIKEASRAVGAMKALLIFPIIQAAGVCVFLVPWVFYTVYLMSSGSFKLVKGTVNGVSFTYKSFDYTTNQRYAQLYLLFAYFWTSEFIVALGQIVVAMAVATWYFTREKNTIGSGTVFASIGKTCFYHAGTAAFGSLIIAIIKTIRAIVAYFQKKMAASKNKVLQMVLCCIQCCLWCFEKCMKFLNKNAYIQTAIFGYSFCSAAKRAFFLIIRNILRVAAVSLVGDFILILGKILIPIATTFLAYIVLTYTKADELNGMIGPLIITFVLAWFTASLFNEVYGMAISTILQCFLADEELFEPAQRYAEGSLSDTIAHINKSHPQTTQVVPMKDGQKTEIV